MVSGTRSTGDGRAADALDRCLGRLRQGDSVDECLASHPQLADELRPLLTMASEMLGTRVEPPKASAGLELGRARLLGAAAASYARADGDGATSPDAVRQAETLDIAVGRVTAGETADAVLADYPELADSLRPLLAMAAQAHAATVLPPRPPTKLARGRDRLLAAASDLREDAAATAAAADGDNSLADALDSCLEGIQGGATIDAVLSEHSHQADALRPLLQAAASVADDVVSPPSNDLSAGRDRMLATAARKRDAATGNRGIGALLASWFGPGRPWSMSRVAVAAAAVFAFMVIGGPLAGQVAADALPGEHLYSVKRLNERIALALLFDPSARDEREIQYSQRRADELLALVGEGRTATIESWKVIFREFIDQSHPSDRKPHGWLFVAPLVEDEEPKTIRLSLTVDTKVDFQGRYGSWDELPPGTGLVLRVETQEQGPTVVLGVLLDEDPEEETPTPDAPGTSEGTAMPQQTGTVPVSTRTYTPDVTATVSATFTSEPFTPTPEESETPDATSTPSPSVGASSRKPSARDRYSLQGYVDTIVDDVTWVVVEQASDRSADRKSPEALVDVSAITADRRSGVTKGAWVRLMGRWIDDAMTRYEAVSLDSYEAAEDSPAPVGQRCRGASSVIGRVAQHDPLQSVTLEDGSSYDLTEVSPGEQPRDIKVGARVEIKYQICEDGRRKATSITVLDAQPPLKPYRGTIDNVESDRFTLVGRGLARYVVLYDASTDIIGAAFLESGQSAQVRGWADRDGRIHAVEVRVAESESPPEATSTRVLPAPSATMAPPAAHSPTPVLDAATAPAEGLEPPALAPAQPLPAGNPAH